MITGWRPQDWQQRINGLVGDALASAPTEEERLKIIGEWYADSILTVLREVYSGPAAVLPNSRVMVLLREDNIVVPGQPQGALVPFFLHNGQRGPCRLAIIPNNPPRLIAPNGKGRDG